MKLAKALIAGAVCLSLLCGCGSVGGDSAQRGNSTGNITNYGSVAEYKDCLYAQAGEKGEKFVKIDSDGTETVLKETMPYFINVIDDTIYYVDSNDDFKLHQMKLDGSEDEAITETAAYYVNVVGNYIYYCNADDNNYKLYRIDRKSKDMNREIISANACHYVNVTEDAIYYSNMSNGGAIYRCDLDGNNEVMLNNVRSLYVSVVGDYIYYSAWKLNGETFEDKRVYRMKLDGSDNVALSDCAAGDINVYNNKVYFTDWDNNTICVMNIDGSGQKVYDEEYGTYINIAKDKMYCIRYTEDTKEMSLDIEDLKTE